MTSDLSVFLVYKPGPNVLRPITLLRCSNQKVVCQVAKSALLRAELQHRALRAVDEVAAAAAAGELARIRAISEAISKHFGELEED